MEIELFDLSSKCVLDMISTGTLFIVICYFLNFKQFIGSLYFVDWLSQYKIL